MNERKPTWLRAEKPKQKLVRTQLGRRNRMKAQRIKRDIIRITLTREEADRLSWELQEADETGLFPTKDELTLRLFEDAGIDGMGRFV